MAHANTCERPGNPATHKILERLTNNVIEKHAAANDGNIERPFLRVHKNL